MRNSSFIYSQGKWMESNEYEDHDVVLFVDVAEKSLLYWEGNSASSMIKGLARKNLNEIAELYPSFKLKKADLSINDNFKQVEIRTNQNNENLVKANQIMLIIQALFSVIGFILWSVNIISNALLSGLVVICSIIGFIVGWNKQHSVEKNIAYALYAISLLCLLSVFFFWNGNFAIDDSQWILHPVIMALQISTLSLDLIFQRKLKMLKATKPEN